MTNTQSAQATLADIYPTPSECQALKRFTGAWAVEGTLSAEGATMPLTGTWSFAPAAAGWGVASMLRGHIDPLGAYEEDDLLGFDAETGLFHIYSLTNTGAVHDHVARWVTSDRLEFDYTGLQGGKPYRETGSVEFIDARTMRVESEDYVDGALSSRMLATLRPAQGVGGI